MKGAPASPGFGFSSIFIFIFILSSNLVAQLELHCWEYHRVDDNINRCHWSFTDSKHPGIDSLNTKSIVRSMDDPKVVDHNPTHLDIFLQ